MVKVNRDIALYHTGTFHHVSATNSDGTPARCRVNGACKTWKTRPDEFRLPVKYGLRDCFYITPRNMAEWEITDDDWDRVCRAIFKDELRKRLHSVGVYVDHTIPDGVLRDLAIENGLLKA